MKFESETNPNISMQLKIIGEELYEMMWELQPSPATLRALKNKLNTLADTAWQEYTDTLQAGDANRNQFT